MSSHPNNGSTVLQVARVTDAQLSGDGAIIPVDISHDSRQIKPGWLFAAIQGEKRDAHQFIPQVLEQGAAGIISERECPADFPTAWLQVEDARRAMALAACEIHGQPSHALALVGITGTNGKTTVAYLINQIIEACSSPSAFLSTIESRLGALSERAERTTPESPDINRFLERAVNAGCRAAVMECSSQALDLHRCDGLQFHTAVFTNLTQDHLDYHVTMESYFDAKRSLFTDGLGAPPRHTITNLDDAYGARLAQDAALYGSHLTTYALDARADVSARDLEVTLQGTSFRLATTQGERVLRSPLVGRPHVYNLLAACVVGLSLGYALDAICQALEICAGAPGRFERVGHAGDFTVVVDYAHTDDALLNVLRTARALTGGRVITVFGCGGDRDRTKRAPMGRAAGSLSDLTILTSDNPRTEDPEQIMTDAEAGVCEATQSYEKIGDRRTAIHHAIKEARSGDVVIIAGKGHEDYQLIGTKTFHFDDREVAREALDNRSQIKT